MENHQEIAGILLRYHRFLIATHVMPDGDAVGSMLGLWFGIAEKRAPSDNDLSRRSP